MTGAACAPGEVASDPMLARILAPDWAALLVVDVQNDFCHQDGLLGRLGFDLAPIRTAVRALTGFVEQARAAGLPVIFTRMEHEPSSNSSAWTHRNAHRRADACVAGTWGAELYRVAPAPGEPVIVKRRYSPFVGTDLEVMLRAAERRSILGAGVSSNVCVESALRDAFMRDYHVVLVEDCAAAFTESEHAATVHNIRTHFGRVLDSRAIAAHWRAQMSAG